MHMNRLFFLIFALLLAVSTHAQSKTSKNPALPDRVISIDYNAEKAL
jgi:hypothetical protein